MSAVTQWHSNFAQEADLVGLSLLCGNWNATVLVAGLCGPIARKKNHLTNVPKSSTQMNNHEFAKICMKLNGWRVHNISMFILDFSLPTRSTSTRTSFFW